MYTYNTYKAYIRKVYTSRCVFDQRPRSLNLSLAVFASSYHLSPIAWLVIPSRATSIKH